ncbi:MAG: CDP-diacylglycerol--glycerol-3-phosphate 3-phosphatidyltransferase [Candidatus Woesearchaeota archaeon]
MRGIFSKANQITYIRILLIPVFVIFLLMEIPYRDYIAAFIFIIISLSDAFDGYIARKNNNVTGIGRILDPIADKLLVSTALVLLIGRIELWMAVIIIVREIVITIIRLSLLSKKITISASNLGKIKTVSQIVAIVAVILNLPFNWWLMLLAVIITVVSGLDYIIKIRRMKGENMLNIPNMITTFRLLLIPLFIINMIESNLNFALVVFTIFVLLDKLDGIWARATKQITNFGSVYDGFADYVLVVSAYITFYMTGLLESFWIIIFAIPSIVLTGTKIIQYSKIKEIPQEVLGKIVIGISYVAAISVIIDFVYKFQVLVLIAILAYVYMAVSIIKILIKKQHESS